MSAEPTARLWLAMALLYLAAGIGAYFLWQTYGQIQDSREQATYDACQDSNDRYHNFIRSLDATIANLPPDRRDQALKGRAANLRLIRTFVVVHEKTITVNGKPRLVSTCREYAKARTRTGQQ